MVDNGWVWYGTLWQGKARFNLENKAFKKAGILNLITRNYKLPKDTLDLETLIDDEIGMSENWHNKIKPIVKKLIEYEDMLKYRGLQ